MATYYVDDGGDNSDGSTWAKAYTSVNARAAAVALASGDIVYFGHDSQCQATNSAHLTIVGPGSGAPVIFISATQGSDPPTYQQATANQIDTTEGAYGVVFNGSFAVYGLKIAVGSTTTGVKFQSDANETSFVENVTIVLPANGETELCNADSYQGVWKNIVIDLTADGTTTRSNNVLQVNMTNNIIVEGLSFINAGYRTGTVFLHSGGISNSFWISGGDFSGFTNATTCEILAAATNGTAYFTNCKMASTWVPFTSSVPGNVAKFVNCGSADQPVSLLYAKYGGNIVSSSSIYRTGGASFETTANAWLVTTTASCTKDSPFYAEYIYGVISTTGSKTFDLYVTNDTADLNDDEIWLEVEYKADASSGKWTLITDKPADRTTAAAAQTDDTTSTWNGTGPSFTYKQKLSVTATVNTTGQYRAKVAVGKASVASSAYLYVDPLVTVS